MDDSSDPSEGAHLGGRLPREVPGLRPLGDVPFKMHSHKVAGEKPGPGSPGPVLGIDGRAEVSGVPISPDPKCVQHEVAVDLPGGASVFSSSEDKDVRPVRLDKPNDSRHQAEED